MHARLAEQVSGLLTVEAWQEWLGLAHSLHRYSFNNTLLILAQKPEATMVAGFGVWKQKGHFVRRGEKAIRVLAPIKKVVDLYDEQGNRVRDANGRPRYTWQIVGVKPVSVFDVSQVDPPVKRPPAPQLLTGQAPAGLWESMSDLARIEGFRVTRGDSGEANGFINYVDREIRVRDGIDDAQAVKTLAHELGHLFTITPADADVYPTQRELREVEAESVAYMVMAAHGLDSGQYTFNYVAGWAARAATTDASVEDVIVATGQRVIAAADRILSHTKPVESLEDDLVDSWVRSVQPSPTIRPDPPAWETVPQTRSSAAEAERQALPPHRQSPSASVPR
jgi:hypothetical protein